MRTYCYRRLCFGANPLIKANYLLLKNIEASGLQISDYRKKKPELMAQCINDIFQLYDDGKLQVPATTTYKLDQFKTAMHEIENRTAPSSTCVATERLSNNVIPL